MFLKRERPETDDFATLQLSCTENLHLILGNQPQVTENLQRDNVSTFICRVFFWWRGLKKLYVILKLDCSVSIVSPIHEFNCISSFGLCYTLCLMCTTKN